MFGNFVVVDGAIIPSSSDAFVDPDVSSMIISKIFLLITGPCPQYGMHAKMHMAGATPICTA